jgi:phosphoglycolate phosphatase
MFRRLDSLATQTICPFPGIKELLNDLHSQGKKLAVWTARDLDSTAQILNHTGLNSYFSICVSASCVEHGKPHPEGLKKISDHFNCEAEAMVMVGDFDSDMLGAKAFGTKAIRVFWHPAVEVKKCPLADWQFHHVSEFITWINEHKK